MPTSALPSSRPSSPNEPAQPSPLPKALPLSAAGLFCIPSISVAAKKGSIDQNDPLFPSPEDQLAVLATKLDHLLRLTRCPRTHLRFMKNCRRSTCGFVFTPRGMAGDGQLNVVDGPFRGKRVMRQPVAPPPVRFLLGGYTSFRIKRRTEEVSKCRITGQYKKETRARWLMGVLSR